MEFGHLIPDTRYTRYSKRNTCIMDACNMLLISVIVCGNTGEFAWQSRSLHEVSTLSTAALLLISDFFNVSLLKHEYRRKAYRVKFFRVLIWLQIISFLRIGCFQTTTNCLGHNRLPVLFDELSGLQLVQLSSMNWI